MLNPRGTSAYENRVATASVDILRLADHRQSAAEIPTISAGSTRRPETKNRLVTRIGGHSGIRDVRRSLHSRTGATIAAALTNAPTTKTRMRTARSGRLLNRPIPERKTSSHNALPGVS